MTAGKHVVSLYRQMLRKGRSLQLTDQNYFYRRMREEFKKNKDMTNKADISFAIQKAETFLKNDRLL